MPAQPGLSESLAQRVVALYAEAERILLARLALNLGAGIDAPDWVDKKLLEIQFLTRQTERLVAELGNRAAAEVAVALAQAYNRGGASAAADLAALLRVGLEEASAPILGLPPVELLVSEAMTNLVAAGQQILRATIDAYRSIIADTAAQVLIGTQTRRQAAQAALNRFAQRGITGLIDKAGRHWSIEAYTEMAMRTATAHATVNGHMDRLSQYGMDLVIISDAPRECPLCRPHEGKVYSISGRDARYPSLQSARDSGLWHPGCRHSASAYQPGITERPSGPKADPEGYRAAQQQRYMERQIRAYKRVEAAAMDDAARKEAQRKIREWQARLRQHVSDNDLKRLPYREQIGRAT